MERPVSPDPTESALPKPSESLSRSKRWMIGAVVGVIATGISLAACSPENQLNLLRGLKPQERSSSADPNVLNEASEKEAKQIAALREAVQITRDFAILDPKTASWLDKLDTAPTFYTPAYSANIDQPLVRTKDRFLSQVLIRPHPKESQSLSPLINVKILKNEKGQVVSRTVELTDDPLSDKVVQPTAETKGRRTDDERFNDEEPIEVTTGELITQAQKRTRFDLSHSKWNDIPNEDNPLWTDMITTTASHPVDSSLVISITRSASGRQVITETNTDLPAEPPIPFATPNPPPPPSIANPPKQQDRLIPIIPGTRGGGPA